MGATAPAELAAVRRIVPGLAFLVPGVGVQGGDLDSVLAAGPATDHPAGDRAGRGLLVNVSRGIAGVRTATDALIQTPVSEDVGERIATAAAGWAAKLPVLR